MATLLLKTPSFVHKSSGALRGLVNFVALCRAAVEASKAIESRRKPAANVLVRLGIAPDSFADYTA
ncbi:hypothetical protein [Pseudotabrizicola algicola]|uniref:Uncharacterized protein n=1 Tax=Pseudotabrizicola algicola TaxID=2709381 RepID=A0A6B3RV14_9RHOB|nr:hypothetical protein [Pseudotabrizicola algicola]NEX48628.1 hypothetical protein [Pseudotabrizicola algicola]